MPIFKGFVVDDKAVAEENQQSSESRLQDVEDQRLRRNVQWGVVRGLFLYTLFMIPIAFVVGLIVEGMR